MYKRQPPQEAPIQAPDEVVPGQGDVDHPDSVPTEEPRIPDEIRPGPVSYTHLDVYKRQDFHSRMRAHGPWADLLRTRFKIACAKNGLKDRHWLKLRTDLFRPPEGAQMRLF